MLYEYPLQSRDIPLSLCWRTKELWPVLQDVMGVSETGAAILLAGLDATQPISYSRNRNHYTRPRRYREPLYTYRKVVAQMDYLDRQGFLISHHIAQQGSRNWQSTFELAPDTRAMLRAILFENGPLVARVRREPLILRCGNGDLMDYRETNATARMRKALRAYNTALSTVRVNGQPVPNLVRIFNGSLARGGRHYANGNSFQNMPKQDRKAIQINGEATIEIDYKALHPSMLYAKVSIAAPHDAYDIDGFDRSLVKIALLILINASTENEVIAALARHDVISGVVEPKSSEAYKLARELVEVLKTVHAPISRYFHSDAGAELMRADSELANAVMQILIKQGVVALPVHDSFIVPISKKSNLEEAMTKAAHVHGYRSLEIKAA